VQAEFLALRGQQLGGLLDECARRYGSSARRQAEQDQADWRNGRVHVSGQTTERLLDPAPPFLAPDRRFNLVTKLRAHFLRPSRDQVRCDLDDWEKEVGAAEESVGDGSRALGFLPDAGLGKFQRMFLVQCLYSQAYWTVSPQDLIHS
jgi:hypothetical protein